MRLVFTDTAWDQYIHWQNEDKKTLKKINRLIKSINRDGLLNGEGKPELLKHDRSGECSRRIDEENRLVYAMVDGQLVIKSCKGHYE